MEIIHRNIDDLIFAEYNPRQLMEKDHKSLTDSIKRFGLVDPVIVNMHPDRENILVGGHQRVRIAKELGFNEVPTVTVNLPYEKERELNIRLNKNSGSWDMDMLANHFDVEELTDWGFEAKELDFGISEEGLGEEFSLPEGDREPFQQMTFTLSDEQVEVIKNAMQQAKEKEEFKYCETYGNENGNGNALYYIVAEWAGQRK